ncbi:class I SAM-dependent methyltransferase [Phreatobacter cathodiphilus]|uniref:SAM-dependent methyltransferase n=1 Tax=Phreatobacter cathodiphilus TaxID=1868589 RepID=A0A2S0NEC7_9HYPH|nr:class I SAM-dependent methyltransferase [Phreatobacter cathodiphilus]AVO46520.1 SAM-dependent methyltransferase [Phreatobacter cathodiphilus]
MADWRSFWDGEHAIYVSDRHKAVHYRAIADGILAHVAEAGLGPDAVVLDYACGEALESARVAGAVGRLVLCDGAPSVVAKLRERFGALPNVAFALPEDLNAVLADGTADLIVVSSLIQYLSEADFAALLDRFRAKLKPGGRLVLADVIPPDAGMAADITSLLRNAWRHGYLPAALVGLVATAVSPYRKIRSEIGLATYAEADMLALMARHGFSARRHHPNLGLTPHRMTFVALPVV